MKEFRKKRAQMQRELDEVQYVHLFSFIHYLKTGYSPCCACAVLFVLVDYYLLFPWFPVRLRNIHAILYLLIQGVGNTQSDTKSD